MEAQQESCLVDLDNRPLIPVPYTLDPKDHKRLGKRDLALATLWFPARDLGARVTLRQVLNDPRAKDSANAYLLDLLISNARLTPFEWKGHRFICLGSIYSGPAGNKCCRAGEYRPIMGVLWDWIHLDEPLTDDCAIVIMG